MDRDELLEKCDLLSLEMMDLYRKLQKDEVWRVLGRQPLRSTTGIGSNVEEAQGAESRPDFIHKMSIAYKEARESGYWIRLMKKDPALKNTDASKVASRQVELIKIITAIIKSSKAE